MLSQLGDAVGPDHVLTDPEVLAGYCVDWTGRFRGATAAVVQPACTVEAAAVVAICRRHGVALVPQGGNTGLVGGSVPLAGELVLSLRRMSAIADVDDQAGQLTAGAGATLAGVQETAEAVGWAYGVDFASRDTATVGGSIATNAGGLRVIRYGDTRAQVVGIEAVLGDGSVVSHLSGLVRDNSGYHLPSLFCGSEGTLGVVTAARLRLVPPVRERVVALVAFDTIDAAVVAAFELRHHVRTLEAVELFLAAGLDLVCRVDHLPHPFPSPHPALLLVEAGADRSPLDDLVAAVNSLEGVADATVAVDEPRRDELWHFRESHPGAISSLGSPHKLDVALPKAHLAEFLRRVPDAVAEVAPAASSWLFGHAADGSVHVNVTGLPPDDNVVDDTVLRLATELGGTISAEHGIGSAKRAYLRLNRSPTEVAAFRAVKRALDPDGILNPNVLLPVQSPGA
ncbi:MAG: FAD-binding oxidoreductase [Actinobacteria bacterium]|nr:FAD-binding oxidoreductase [Actinomycetota bacterium]